MSVTQQHTTHHCATPEDRVAWQAYWAARDQPWRTQPEISLERQRFPAQRRTTTPKIIQVGLRTGKPPTLFDALAMSIQSLHGRVFVFQAGDPRRVVNTVEAMVGLFVEALIVAVITRRIPGLR